MIYTRDINPLSAAAAPMLVLVSSKEHAARISWELGTLLAKREQKTYAEWVFFKAVVLNTSLTAGLILHHVDCGGRVKFIIEGDK